MKQKVALVLSGGGARGIAHIGVIEELEKQGFEISAISGTSMGAVIGGVYALGKLQAYKEWLYTLDRMKLFGLLDFSFSTQGLVKGDKLFHTIEAFIADEKIEDFHIPFAAVATDILNKAEVVFKTGSIFEAVRASMAFPTIFTPIKTEKGLLVDGGVLNNLPIDHVARVPSDILVAVDVNADVPVETIKVSAPVNHEALPAYQQKIKEFYSQFQKFNPLSKDEKLSYFNLMNKTISLMTNHITQLTLEKYSVDILINISRDSCATFDFYRAEEMVEVGRNAAIKYIAECKTK